LPPLCFFLQHIGLRLRKAVDRSEGSEEVEVFGLEQDAGAPLEGAADLAIQIDDLVVASLGRLLV
jgi:hypothetical protein